MFEGFEQRMIDTGEAVIRVRSGGSGPPLLLLHGNPQTQEMWHLVAPRLAEDFTVVLSDLRGYGDSSKPPTDAEHSPYSKRAMARDQVAVMRELGFETFNLAGHDRGGRCAYRLALDHPDRVRKLALLDIIPTSEAFWRGGKDFAMGYWHWFFLAQPHDIPERIIGADPDYFFYQHTAKGTGKPAPFTEEARLEYLRCFRNPETIFGICEDYRAGASIDIEHDAADKQAGRRIRCPLLALWGARASLEGWYDVLEIWREWADDVQGRPIDSGHYLAEEAPEDTYQELKAFFSA